jgi:cytochrome P450
VTDTSLCWDPFDERIDDDPYEVWRRMRDEAPVYRNERHDFWALSRFEDVEAAHRDPVTFSSAHGTVLERMSADVALTGMMINLDPPAHTQLRSVVSRALTPRRMAELEGQVREVCASLLDPQVGRGGFDFVEDFAAIVPSRVISMLLGVPKEDQERQRRLVDAMFHVEPGVGMANDTSMTAALALVGYLAELIQERTGKPQDDMVSDLIRAEIVEDGDTRRLTLEECTRFALLLYTAGTETTGKLLGNAAVLLADHPDQRAVLVNDPSWIPNAIEELLRYEAPSPVQGRWTTTAIIRHDIPIPSGSKVLLLTGSAGRDERVFPNPDRFDVRRSTRQHLSFGYGIHFCLGAALARLEARVALEEMFKRFPAWQLDRAGVERVHTSTVRGYGHVPVVV